ncbi:putative F-box protein At1g32420 [Silene latifolia]|uniref:putative F-box protein At1g32420 n=1 Tax=Silene latifolia TaxID=37657 RepID=UPI003D773CD2
MMKVLENHAPNSAKFGRSRSRGIGGYFNRLPCEILHNIALMLPFASIIELKHSSKFWYNLVTDPKFVDLHLSHALAKPPGYLFTHAPVCYFVEQSRGHVSISKMFEYSFDDFERKMGATFQSSGGLMCAYRNQPYCFRIFNPHIGEEVQVPCDPKFKRWRFRRFFFCYSPSIKKYKILKLGESKEKKGNREPATAEICTLGSNIWREIQNVPSWDINGYIQCQGNPFWMKESDLHYFDLVSEKFHAIPGPPVLDRVHVTHYMGAYANIMMTNRLISMGDKVGYVHNNRLWVLEDKRKGIWINRYDFSIPRLYGGSKLIGTSENGNLFGYNYYPNIFFSHDMGCTGFKVMENKLDEYGSEDDDPLDEYVAPHVRSLVSPVRIVKMENKLINHKRKRVIETLKMENKLINHKRKSVIETLKLDYDATEDDLVNKMYEFLQAYEKHDKAKTHNEGVRYSNSRQFRKR